MRLERGQFCGERFSAVLGHQFSQLGLVGIEFEASVPVFQGSLSDGFGFCLFVGLGGGPDLL